MFDQEFPLYVGAEEGLPQDIRESNGRTHYISAGVEKQYQDIRWMIDEEGRIYTHSKQGVTKYLSAHRTYISDCYDASCTFAISTNFKGHENTWNFHRVGALN